MEVNLLATQTVSCNFRTFNSPHFSGSVDLAINRIQASSDKKPSDMSKGSCWKLITTPFNKLLELVSWMFRKIFCCFLPKPMDSIEIIKKIDRLIEISKDEDMLRSSEYRVTLESLPTDVLTRLKKSAINHYIIDSIDNHHGYEVYNESEWKKQNTIFLNSKALAILLNYAGTDANEILVSYRKELEKLLDKKV